MRARVKGPGLDEFKEKPAFGLSDEAIIAMMWLGRRT